MNQVLAFITLAVIVGCSKAPSPSGIIDRFGTYASPDKRLSLVISKHDRVVVAFTVSSATDGRTLYSDRIGSDAQRWCFYWDELGRLWAYSSDTGYFAAFSFEPDGTVTKAEWDRSTQIPKPVYEFLPRGLKETLGI